MTAMADPGAPGARESGSPAEPGEGGCRNKPPRLASIGHSNHSWERFLELLVQNGVEIVVDTRSRPYSSYSPHFDREPLRRSLEAARIRYMFEGRGLGGRPDNEEFYDAEGRVLYCRVAQSPLFLEALARVKMLAERKTALFCSEENPSTCHRRLLITRVLREQGIGVDHIRGDGRVESEEDLLLAETDDEAQLALFDLPSEKPWRSLRSVLPEDRRPTSSKP
jgi:hypothetical protein